MVSYAINGSILEVRGEGDYGRRRSRSWLKEQGAA
jgi:hypothetical protein